MTKHYKLWIEIEEFDDANDSYTTISDGFHCTISDDGDKVYGQPVPLGTFNTVCEAQEAAELLCDWYGEPR
jgi:hypothetical protein